MSTTCQLTVWLDEEIREALDSRATALKVSRSELIREVLDIGLAAINDEHDLVALRRARLQLTFGEIRATAAKVRGDVPEIDDDDVPY